MAYIRNVIYNDIIIEQTIVFKHLGAHTHNILLHDISKEQSHV